MHQYPLDQAQTQIDWILAHPGISDWLKATLASALKCDRIDVWNDLQILSCALNAWCETTPGGFEKESSHRLSN